MIIQRSEYSSPKRRGKWRNGALVVSVISAFDDLVFGDEAHRHRYFEFELDIRTLYYSCNFHYFFLSFADIFCFFLVVYLLFAGSLRMFAISDLHN